MAVQVDVRVPLKGLSRRLSRGKTVQLIHLSRSGSVPTVPCASSGYPLDAVQVLHAISVSTEDGYNNGRY